MSADSEKAESVVDVYDYVIVGAGPSAMGILRGLLEQLSDAPSSNDQLKSLSIAVVERGHGPPHDNATYSPHRWFEAANPNANCSRSVKLFPSIITGRAMDIPVGQGLGGTSNVNACLCLPPLERDLKSWPDPYRASLESNAKYLKRIMEDNEAIQHTSMGNSHNPFSVKNSILSFRTTVPTMSKRDVKANTVVRSNYFDALLDPLLKKHPCLEQYLHWFRGYEVQRLLLKGNSSRVIGIECVSTGDNATSAYREIHANKRVILCAGAIETPALLLVSKLGGKEPLLGVGHHLTDQALLARVYIQPPSLRDDTESPNGIKALGHLTVKTDESQRGCQIFQVAISDSVADASIIPSVFSMALRWKFKRKILSDIVEIVFRCLKAILYLSIRYTPLGFILEKVTTTTMVFLMHPRSRGSVTISPKKNSRPDLGEPERRRHVMIQVDPKYLDDPQDVKDLKDAWDASKRISSSFEVFPSLVFSVLKPFRSRDFWFESYCWCFSLPYYHFSGTCAMKTETGNKDNPNWVVDSSLKVRGHDGLYVCDASTFPATISNPPALTCAALGYEFARLIFAQDGLEKFSSMKTSFNSQKSR
jgi:choline dehydrogenase-like flavoprotein